MPKFKTYHEYRAHMWATLDRTDFNFHGSQFEKDGKVWKLAAGQVVFQPKPILFFKDTWHCGDTDTAKRIIWEICRFPDLTHVELKGKWVSADYTLKGVDHILPGQAVDTRSKYRG